MPVVILPSCNVTLICCPKILLWTISSEVVDDDDERVENGGEAEEEGTAGVVVILLNLLPIRKMLNVNADGLCFIILFTVSF